ncbi:uracil-DNA glycosylase [Flavobacteriaceae bacterium KMM 6897]|nr:uracil-DNA glycosylase [Flavobacteriaceae bacterium KMM 6897]MEB8345341.1 uracil-DNA glycosylase [Flavobacteriaceae bacterium KMM 6898]
MNIDIHPSWKEQLYEEFNKSYFSNLLQFVTQEYEAYICYPEREHIFAAFDHCPFQETKVVIIGQDPYHGPNQAHGLCFSVKDGMSHPPSLSNIFKEIQSDIGKPYPVSGNLEDWAKQGVLLLNATLTVRATQAGSHQKKGWETFTDKVIQKISEEREGVIFLLWGGFAQKKLKLIDTTKHSVLTSGHPSPLSANRGYWFGNNHFSACNELLIHAQKERIAW